MININVSTRLVKIKVSSWLIESDIGVYGSGSF